jgi:predicted TIM-barrel fold metal-dependent hydrolase
MTHLMTAEPSVPVIDMWAPVVPSAEIVDDLRAGFPAEQLRYLEVFTKRTISAQQFSDYADSLRRTDEQILDSLDAAGITLSLVTGFDEKSTCGVTFVHNVAVAAVVARHPDRFLPFAGWSGSFDGSQTCTNSVVLQRHWRTEQGHDPVTGELVHSAAVTLHYC